MTATTETTTEVAKTNSDNRVYAKLTPKMKAEVEKLANEIGKKQADVLSAAVAFYLEHRNNSALTATTELSEEPQKWFVNSTPETKAEIKEALGIEGDSILLTEVQLFEKAKEYSNLSIEEMRREGGQAVAQKIIAQNAKSKKVNALGDTKGIAGGADSRLDEMYETLKQQILDGSYKPKSGIPSLATLAARASTNVNSAKGWALRRGHTELLK